MPKRQRLDILVAHVNGLFNRLLGRINHPLPFLPHRVVIELNGVDCRGVGASKRTSIVMDVIVIVLKESDLLGTARKSIMAQVVINRFHVAHLEWWLRDAENNVGLQKREFLAVARRVETHELGIAALHCAVDVCALHIELLRVILWLEQLVVFDISLAIPAAEKITLAHTFSCQKPFADLELVELTIFNWGTSTMPHQLKDKCDLLVRVNRPMDLFKRAILS